MKVFCMAFALFAIGLLVSSAAETTSEKIKEWKSPDGSSEAVTKNFRHASDADYTDWDVVTIRDAHYKFLASLSLEEGSGITRAVVTEALWSPDSRFFVFQTASSGGHSAWHVPTYVYDAKTSLIYSIDDTVGAITSDNTPLHFTHGDVLHLELWDFKWEKDSDPSSFPRDIPLLDFVKSAKKAQHSERESLHQP